MKSECLYNQNVSSEFFDMEWMFGIHDGFDVVIGNPPYVGEKGFSYIFDQIKKSEELIDYYRRRSNLYYFFLIKGVKLLLKNGIISFIVPNEFLTVDWGNKLRNFIANETQFNFFIDFSSYSVFSEANTSSLIFSFIKKKKILDYIFTVKKFNQFIEDKIMTDINFLILNKNTSEIDLTGIKPWSFYQNKISNKEGNLFLLGEIFEVAQGIVTGVDKVTQKHIDSSYISNIYLNRGIFILDENIDIKFENDKIFLNFSNENNYDWIEVDEQGKKFIRPYITSKELDKWLIKKSNQYLIYIGNKKLDSLTILDYLKQFDQILLNRCKISNKIITLSEFNNFTLKDINLNYSSAGSVQKIMRKKEWFLPLYERFEIPFESFKIIFNTKKMDLFCYSSLPHYSSGGGLGGQNYIYLKNKTDYYNEIVNKTTIENFIKYVNSLLNSKIIKKYISTGSFNQLSTSKTKDIQLYKINFNNLSEKKIYDQIVSLVNNIIERKELEQKTQDLEDKIDLTVYKLYELTYDEVKIVDPEFKLSEYDYNSFTVVM